MNNTIQKIMIYIYITQSSIYMRTILLLISFFLFVGQIAQSKLRHLLNFTVQTAVPPIVKCLSGNQIAYETDNTITVFDVHKKVVTQSIVSQTKPEMQVFSQNGQILYNSGNGSISQIASKENDISVKKALYNLGETLPSTVVKEIIALPQVDLRNQNMKVHFFDSKNREESFVEWRRNPQNISSGSSPITFMENGDFYSLSGCEYSSSRVLLWKGSYKQDNIDIILKRYSDTCIYGKENSRWNLQSYEDGKDRYHLIQFPPYQQNSKLISSSFIMQNNGSASQKYYFYADGQIGANILSNQTLFTADNILCRVLRHNSSNRMQNILNNDFPYQPDSLFVSNSQRYISITTDDVLFFAERTGQIYQVLGYNSIENKRTVVQPNFNVTKLVTFQDQYFILQSDSPSDNLKIRTIENGTLVGALDVYDFCVSDNYIYVVKDLNQTYSLQVYEILSNSSLKHLSHIELNISVKNIHCLDAQTIILTPQQQNETLQTWFFGNQTLNFLGSLGYNTTIHNQFSWVKDIIIFTDLSLKSSKFYNYSFAELHQNFNLPPKAFYSAARYLNGGLLLAVGNSSTHFSSFQYFEAQNSTLKYKGTFPYVDGVYANHLKTFIFPNKNFMHIGLDFPKGEFAITFNLQNSPMKSIGYFLDPNTNECSSYKSAKFLYLNNINLLAALVHSVPPRLQKLYINENDLSSDFQISLDKFKTTQQLQIKISSSKKYIIISGKANNDSLYLEVRDINQIQHTVYSQYLSQSEQLNGVQFVQNKVFFVSSGKQVADFRVETPSNFQIPTWKYYEKITLYSACPNCSLVASTGLLTNLTDDTNIRVDDLSQTFKIATVIACGCVPSIIALSVDGALLAYSCLQKISIYNFSSQVATNYSRRYPGLREIRFYDNERLLTKFEDNNILIYNISQLAQQLKSRSHKVQANVYSLGPYALNYQTNTLAILRQNTSIWLFSFNSQFIDSFTVNTESDISSLSFNSNNELYLSTANGTIIALTLENCSDYETYVDGYCICNQLFTFDNDQCVCNHVLIDNQCVCKEGYFIEDLSTCTKCSLLCDSCSSSDLFDCNSFGAWFYLITILIVALIIAIVVLIVYKSKKGPIHSTLYTGEKTHKEKEPLVSDKIQNYKLFD